MAEDISKHKLNELNNKFTLADRDNYSVQEWLTFLRHLPSNISAERMKVLDESLQFSAWTNAEIQFEWFLKSISSNYTPAYPYLKCFFRKKSEEGNSYCLFMRRYTTIRLQKRKPYPGLIIINKIICQYRVTLLQGHCILKLVSHFTHVTDTHEPNSSSEYRPSNSLYASMISSVSASLK